jgi:hypothetical protein
MNEDSRYDGASQCNGDPWFRWAFYEITLFGDPSLDVWTAVPDDITADFPSAVMIEATEIQFETDAPGARIGLIQENELIGRGIADESGNLQLFLFNPLSSQENIQVSITAHNKNRLTGTIEVTSNEPFIVYNSFLISDSTGNSNNAADYGETIDLSIELRNLGNQPADNVNALLSTTSPFISISDNTEFYGEIAAFGTKVIENGYRLQISDNIPDQTQINLNLEITGSNRYTWYSDFTMIVNAPAFRVNSWQIDDTFSGNGNSRLDPGETVDIILATENYGNAISSPVTVELTCMDAEITVNTSAQELGTFDPAQLENVVFSLTVDSEAAIGALAELHYSLAAANYPLNTSETFSIGLIADDFESGNFSSFDWQTGGNSNWFITSTSPYEGSYCAQSGNISHNQTSTLFLEADVASAGSISFFHRVSSESNYDYLKFYIDDVVQGQWSGESGWEESSYPVSAGNHTFKWSYEKDGSVHTGNDCAWLDFVVFPAINLPGYPDFACDPVNFSETLSPDQVLTRDLWISNIGDNDSYLNYDIVIDFSSAASPIAKLNSRDRNISGSTFESDLQEYLPDTSFDILFTIYNASTDNEWLSAASLDFPEDVIVNSSTDFVVSSRSLTTDNNTGDGALISWNDSDGGWGNVLPGESAEATVNVTVEPDFSGEMILHWTLSGDIWGSEPHTISGQIILLPVWLAVQPNSGSVAGGSNAQLEVNFNSGGLEIGTYEAELLISHNAGEPVIIPVNLTVSQSEVTISGTVTHLEAPLENVLISGINTTPESVITAADGYYSFTAEYNTLVTLTPEKTGYNFEPQLFHDNVTSNTVLNFSATEWVPEQPQNGLPQGSDVPLNVAEISWDPAVGSVPVSYYEILMSVHSDYSEPLIDANTSETFYSLELLDLNYDEEYFVAVTAYYQLPERGSSPALEWSFITVPHIVNISGYVNRGLTPVMGVAVNDTVFTDEAGFYSFYVPYADDVVLIPELINYTFNPETVTFNNVQTDIQQNFTAIKLAPATPEFINYELTDTTILLSWEQIPGATAYRIYSSDNPYSGFSIEATVSSTTWSGTRSGNKRFYRITAVN